MASSPLTFLHGRRTPHCRAKVDKQYDGYWSLQYLTAGAVELFYDDRRHEISRDGVWFAWPGPRIRFHSMQVGWWDHRYIAFTGEAAEQWSREGLIGRVPQAPPGGPGLADRFDRMLSLAFRPGRWGPLRAANLLEGILLELAEARSGETADEPAWLTDICEALHCFDEAGPDYEALAARHDMALSTLRRRFREEVGMSLHQRHLQVKTQAACEMLLDTDLAIKEIASRLGYRDVYFFSRQFKQQAGLSPAAFRHSGM